MSDDRSEEGSGFNVGARARVAIRWSAITRFIGQVISWSLTLVVIRLLEPEDYGLIAMATLLISLLYLVNDFGLDGVLIQSRHLDETMRQQILAAVVIANLTILIGLQFAAPLIAAFFSREALTSIIRVLALQFLFHIFETLPQSRLERDLDFKRRSLVELGATLAGGLITLALAIRGMGVWSLVWGNLLSVLTRVIGLNYIAPCRYRPRFSLIGMTRHLRFGRMILADKTLWFVFSESDKFIGGKLLGAEQLGYYVVSQNIATLPINKLAGLVRSIAFPAFSEVQAERVTVREYLLTTMRMAAIVFFPIFFGLAAVADELVPVALGERWTPGVMLLKVLAVVMPLRMVSVLFPPVLWGIGRPEISAGNYLFAAIFMPAALAFGAVWGGITGLAVAWLCAFPIVFWFFLARTARLLALPVSRVLATLARPALASLVMLLCIEAFRLGIALTFVPLNSTLTLLAYVLAGVLVYSAIIWTLHREGVKELLTFLTR